MRIYITVHKLWTVKCIVGNLLLAQVDFPAYVTRKPLLGQEVMLESRVNKQQYCQKSTLDRKPTGVAIARALKSTTISSLQSTHTRVLIHKIQGMKTLLLKTENITIVNSRAYAGRLKQIVAGSNGYALVSCEATTACPV